VFAAQKNVALVTSLGADHVIDHAQTILKDLQSSYDIIFDTLGKYSLGSVRHLISPKDRYLTTVLSFRAVFDMTLSTFRSKKVSLHQRDYYPLPKNCTISNLLLIYLVPTT